MSQFTSVTVHPDIQNGTPVFSGTRIPVETFFDYMRIGVSVREFLDEFPSITPDQAYEVWGLAEQKYSVEKIQRILSSPPSSSHHSHDSDRFAPSASRG